jgi:plastocyanin domain-containing protein
MKHFNLKSSIFILVAIIVIVGLVFVLNSLQGSKKTSAEAVLGEDGVQVITVTAKNGYTPGIINAKSDTPTILRIKTENTFDCSAAISIPELNYSKFLPPSANSDVQILPQKPGSKIVASCSMGMYGFEINFV